MTDSNNFATNGEGPIYHVILVGFHHKQGCVVEYSYPPLEVEIEKTAWKHLPTLAMPDGAHNYAHDTVYFHLPSLKNPKKTVFGVACYQQIKADKLKFKPDDVTRSTVQKSVCVLSRYPLFGHIQVKMSLITAAFFREGDFSQVTILEEAYNNLNTCLNVELLKSPEAFVGLSPRDLVFTFRHDVLTLFKLLLLEKRILFRGAAVGPLCSTILTLISLLPHTLESGLNESACVQTKKAMSIVPKFSISEPCDETDKMLLDSIPEIASKDEKEDLKPYVELEKNHGTLPELDTSTSIPKSETESSFDKYLQEPDFLTAVQMTPTEAGLPLHLFTNGYLCHPYLSLHYLDLLGDSSVRGFVVGATNILFKQKKDLVDVIVEMENGSIEISDPILKRNLTLTTQDFRFAENIVKQVTQEGRKNNDSDGFMDGVGWEGGDEWIRAQFKYYLISMLRTSLLEEGDRFKDSYSPQYFSSWQTTVNWTKWKEYVNSEERDTPGIYALNPGHPFEGQMSISDMKIRVAHAFQNTESGRRLNHAVLTTGKAVSSQTGKVVSQTGKIFGGAITSAKGAFSSWWSNVNVPAPSPPNVSEEGENNSGNTE